ncbi:MAG: hypothetical protein WD063_10325 [Pirellulales bacterium]
MKSGRFFTDEYKTIERKIKTFLNEQKEFLSGRTVKSTRAVGDAIEDILSENFQAIVGDKHCVNYSSDFPRRAMADFAFDDRDSRHYRVDVKTHRVSTKFNMPNLTSVRSLSKFYEDDKNYFVVLSVAYDTEGLRVVVSEVKFVPIEFLEWNCLTIGALGWGQIQIANANRIAIKRNQSRKAWMLQLCDHLSEFYPREMKKIGQRTEYFAKVRRRWEAKGGPS